MQHESQHLRGRYPVQESFRRQARISGGKAYELLYARSIQDPEGFWSEKAKELLTWYCPWEKTLEGDFARGRAIWFRGGKLNVSYNCLDRHVQTWRRNKAAIIFEGERIGDSRTFTYQDLFYEVNKLAQVIKKLGIQKGDRVVLYLPMIPHLVIAMLACARIGAVHSVVFGGFSAESLANRIQDCQARLLITGDGGFRSGRVVTLKHNADEALNRCPSVEKVLVVRRTRWEVRMKPGRDLWYHREMRSPDLKPFCPPEWMDAEDPLFILYTSGSTGKPKGLVHTSAGYLLYAASTFLDVFDYRDEDTFWCTADIGWITGHSYLVYGPLCSGATSVMFEGVPSYPSYDRFWDVTEKHRISIFYTAPTAIRGLRKKGEDLVRGRDIASLRLLGSVGEPIDPESWQWYYDVVGQGRCPIVDTWWQTETGGILLSPLPGAIDLKPGSVTVPLFGIQPCLLNDRGEEVHGPGYGYLCMKSAWPGMARTIFNDPLRFEKTYFADHGGYYFTGDGARRDEDGYYWITGRVDDVINVSGHRLGTAELENALTAHPAVAEAAVVGYPHEIKGEGIYAFVTLKPDRTPGEALQAELIEQMRRLIGPIAAPDRIQWADALPKTRSGKVMRRLLRKISAGQQSDLGDISTLLDPETVQRLIKGAEEVRDGKKANRPAR
ncbi:MAG: acetate--CoA ligase [Deltaproteobacteria bacterium]|nr:acetate--CoA ligase [Deltaproteobacteria bacterium]